MACRQHSWAADGPLPAVGNTSALSAGVLGVAVASSGVVYFTDSFQHWLRAVFMAWGAALPPRYSPNAYVQTLAWHGAQSLAGNGGPAAAAALLLAPTFLVLDKIAGVLYVVDHPHRPLASPPPPSLPPSHRHW